MRRVGVDGVDVMVVMEIVFVVGLLNARILRVVEVDGVGTRAVSVDDAVFVNVVELVDVGAQNIVERV